MAAEGSLVIDAEPTVRTRLTGEEFMAACEARVFGDVAHVELVDGELVETPPEGSDHAFNNVQTLLVLGPIVRRIGGLEIGANMAILLGPGRVVGPDVVVTDPVPGRPTLTPASAVRLAVENAWSSRRYDLTRKAELHAAAGVPEYWVLDDVEPSLHRFHTARDGRYARDPARGPEERVAVPFAPGETVRVGDLFR